MVGLTEFVVQYCALSGTLPSWISELTSLQAFGLSGNGNLEGTIPTDMIQQLTNLRLLSLDGNQFRGNIMDLLLLSQPSSLSLNTLTRLHLDDNQLTGSIANAFLSNLPKLRELDVSGNSLEGPLPTNLFHHPVLEVIDLHGNDITGTIPNTTVIVVESVVKLLALQNNGLTGSVPASLSNLIGLKHLDVSSNFLTGSLPSGLGRLAELEYFYVGWNPLLDEAPIPEWMFSSSSWTQLRELSLARSGITGSIPASLFEYLTNLEYLNLCKLEEDGGVACGWTAVFVYIYCTVA
jgi:LRR receptor-like serine/threonine-protein kinase FLS2